MAHSNHAQQSCNIDELIRGEFDHKVMRIVSLLRKIIFILIIMEIIKNTVKTINPLNNKNSNILYEMSDILGVSGSVIKNVIFCHQEDSNW